MDDISIILEGAERDFLAGEIESAISLCGAVLREEPENIPALRRQAIAYLRLENPNYVKAVINLRNITQGDREKSRGTMPSGWSFYKDLALLSYAYMQLEQYDATMEISSSVLRAFSDNLLALFSRGEAKYNLCMLGEDSGLDLAVDDFEHVVRVGEQIKRKSFLEYSLDNQYFTRLAILGSVMRLGDIYKFEFKPFKSLVNGVRLWQFNSRFKVQFLKCEQAKDL